MKLLQLAPNDSRIKEAYAEYLFAIEDFKNAVHEYEWVLKKEFHYPPLHLYQQLMICYDRLGNIKAAKKIALKMKDAILQSGTIPEDTKKFFLYLGVEV